MAMRRAENANDDYSKHQAGQYIKHKREAMKHDAFKTLQEQGKDTSDKSIERFLKDNAVYQAVLEDEEKIQKGTLDETLMLRYANIEINARNKELASKDQFNKDLKQEYDKARQAQAEGKYVDHLTIAQGMVDKGHSYTQIGPNGIITSDKNYYDAWKKLIAQNGQLDGKNFNFNGDTVKQKFKEYGNNYFVMFTGYPEVKQQLVCDGIMTELPPFSMSTEWANSPAGSVGEELDKLLNNEFLEFLGQKTATSQYAVMRRKDQLTARSYKDTGDISFSIKFRCYPGQLVGSKPMTSAKEWLLTLAMTTPINSACSFSVNNAIGTLARAADGAAKAFEDLKDAIKGERTNSDGSKTQVNAEAAVTGMNQVFGSQNAISLDKYNQENVRLSNPKVFGANLFGLRIYPWLFKEPLIVYVSSWNVVPSKEWNESVNDHYYYDFTLNCTMDQKPAAQTWQLKLFNKQLDDHLFYA
jgi:hypothetical protein